MRVLNADQMREADRQTIADVGISSLVLMENAGRQVVAAMESAYSEQMGGRIAVLCGRGNNGGDGFVVARTLRQRGTDATVFVIGSLGDIRGDARTNLEILGRLGMTVVEITDEQQWELHVSEISQCDLIVDALFGTGLKAPLSGMFETVVADLNGAGLPIVSIDLPSGLSADTPEQIGTCIEASMSVALAAPKLPLVLPPGEMKSGNVVVADIGVPTDIIDGITGPRIDMLTREHVREIIEPRPADSHKGDFGHVLVVAGSRGKTGAAHLAAAGALQSGAGLVTIAAPRSCQDVLAAMGPEYMTEGLDETEDGLFQAAAVERLLLFESDVVAAGPGLGRSDQISTLVARLLDEGSGPLVLDADALHALIASPDRLRGREGRDVVITPHPGEMGRLVGMSSEEVQAHRIDVARNFATSNHVYVVLKGHRTLIATPAGRVYINPTGNPGMATGGTGDVLTGMVAAWLGQLLDAEAACKVAVYLHGLAGDLAEADHGEVSMTAVDLAAHISDAIQELTARRRVEHPNPASDTRLRS